MLPFGTRRNSLLLVAALFFLNSRSEARVYKSIAVRVDVKSTAPLPMQDFQTRCNQPGVIKCVGFDSPSDIAGSYGDNSGIMPGATVPVLDTTQKSSGNSSIKFLIKSNTGANVAGAYFTNFSNDLSVQFDENSDFFVQWRQRFDDGMMNKFLDPDGFTTGWKQGMIGTGDKPGCKSSDTSNGKCYSSCSDLEVVTTSYYDNKFPIIYNSCDGSTSHGKADIFTTNFGSSDFKLQNAMPSPFCLYSQNKTSYFSPSGNCFGYATNEWMTFQVEIKPGTRVNDEFKNSYIKLWIAREGQSSQLVLDFGPYNLTAGPIADLQKFGKVWLTPYISNKSASQNHPPATTWYDELIISRQKIADPK